MDSQLSDYNDQKIETAEQSLVTTGTDEVREVFSIGV